LYGPAIVQYEREKVETKTEDREHLYKLLAMKYKECMNDMSGRAPGKRCTTLLGPKSLEFSQHPNFNLNSSLTLF